MTRTSRRATARQFVAYLPELPQPWRIETLCQRLERARGRPLLLHAVSRPSFPSGLWHDDGAADHIFYRSSASGWYRDHIILHEMYHMLESGSEGNSGGADGLPVYSNEEEVLAETFASLVLKLVGHRKRFNAGNTLERRAGDLFGIPEVSIA